MRMIITIAKEVMFWFYVFGCLSPGSQENSDFHDTWWKSVVWAKEEPVKTWNSSESWISVIMEHSGTVVSWEYWCNCNIATNAFSQTEVSLWKHQYTHITHLYIDIPQFFFQNTSMFMMSLNAQLRCGCFSKAQPYFYNILTFFRKCIQTYVVVVWQICIREETGPLASVCSLWVHVKLIDTISWLL